MDGVETVYFFGIHHTHSKITAPSRRVVYYNAQYDVVAYSNTQEIAHSVESRSERLFSKKVEKLCRETIYFDINRTQIGRSVGQQNERSQWVMTYYNQDEVVCGISKSIWDDQECCWTAEYYDVFSSYLGCSHNRINMMATPMITHFVCNMINQAGLEQITQSKISAMQTQIDALSSVFLSVKTEALRFIYDHISEEVKHNKQGSVYYKTAKEYGVIKKLVNILSDKHFCLDAQKSLLLIEDEGQFEAEAGPIMEAMMMVMARSLTPVSVSSELLLNSLRLLNRLPLDKPCIQSMLLEKNVGSFLERIKKIYAKYTDRRGVVCEINHILSRLHGLSERISVLPASMDSPSQRDLQVAYLARSGFFNAHHEIFNNRNSLDCIILTLQARAAKNPGGASDQTLRQFGLT